MEKLCAAIVGLWLVLVGAVEGVSPICDIVKEFDFRETNPFAFRTFPTNRPQRRRVDAELGKIFVRKLQLFALKAIVDGDDYDSDDDGGEEENGGSEETLLLNGNADNRDWELWTEKRECRCAKRHREDIENALYMYCGGHSDYHCCPQLEKYDGENLEKCCQKTICKNTSWLHGEEYLQMCYDDWFCG